MLSKNKIRIDLTRVPEKKMINKLIKKLKMDYPTLYKIIIEEGNFIIARNLNKLISTNKSVVAVIGAGHEEDVLKIIKNENK